MGHKICKFTRILSFCFVQHWVTSAYKFSKFVHKIRHNIGVLLLQVIGTTDNRYVVRLVNNTTTIKRGDASARLIGTTNPQQIEVMEFVLIVAERRKGDNLSPIVAVFGDYSSKLQLRLSNSTCTVSCS